MVRYIFAQQKVLELYRAMTTISFPVRPEDLLRFLPIQTKMMSYQQMAVVTGCSVEDVAVMCNSTSGATHYDSANHRCLILYNDDAPSGRILWTQCHEIGHICLGHLQMIQLGQIANSDGRIGSEFEQEADYFAWNLLAPMPIMREMKISGVPEVIKTFGLSVQAANLQFDRFRKWQRSHTKTSWENNILREYRRKSNKDSAL